MRPLVRSSLLVVALLAAACGGGSKDDAGSTSSSSPSASPSVDPSVAAAADAAAAERVVLTQADLGAGWKVHTKAAGELAKIRATGRLGCTMDDVNVRPWVAMHDGAILQKLQTNRYVTSTGLVFADETAAKAYVVRATSKAYTDCHAKDRAEQDHKTPTGEKTSRWRADPPKIGQPPLQLTIDFYFQAVVSGKLIDANGFERDFFYRSGRTVLFVAHEGTALEGEKPAVATTTMAEVTRAGDAAIKKATAQ